MTNERVWNIGVVSALGAALLFGAGTPLAKFFLDGVGLWMLAGLFYLGSGMGLSLYRLVSCATPVRLPRGEAGWLAGAVLAGGVIAPVLLMMGITGMRASGASLLLNAEGIFTALLAWIAFRENFDRRIALARTVPFASAYSMDLAIAKSIPLKDGSVVHQFKNGQMAMEDKYGRTTRMNMGETMAAADGATITMNSDEQR